MTPRQINAIVRKADGRNVYAYRTRLGDETVHRVTRARGSRAGDVDWIYCLHSGQWFPFCAARGDRIEVR